jgi:hypothetical protein
MQLRKTLDSPRTTAATGLSCVACPRISRPARAPQTGRWPGSVRMRTMLSHERTIAPLDGRLSAGCRDWAEPLPRLNSHLNSRYAKSGSSRIIFLCPSGLGARRSDDNESLEPQVTIFGAPEVPTGVLLSRSCRDAPGFFLITKPLRDNVLSRTNQRS